MKLIKTWPHAAKSANLTANEQSVLLHTQFNTNYSGLLRNARQDVYQQYSIDFMGNLSVSHETSDSG